jgi:hypothetical protein
MKKTSKPTRTSDGMRTEYDFSGAVRNKYAARFREGTNVVLLDPDVAKAFPDSEAVNHALRNILDALPARATRRKTRTA